MFETIDGDTCCEQRLLTLNNFNLTRMLFVSVIDSITLLSKLRLCVVTGNLILSETKILSSW